MWTALSQNCLKRLSTDDTCRRSYIRRKDMHTSMGGTRISGKGVHINKDVGFALLIFSHFS